MSHRKSDLGIPCSQKICQSSARSCTHKSGFAEPSVQGLLFPDIDHLRFRQVRGVPRVDMREFRDFNLLGGRTRVRSLLLGGYDVNAVSEVDQWRHEYRKLL